MAIESESFIMGDNTYVGTDAGVSGEKEEARNSGFGHRSLYENSVGKDNTALGCETLTNNDGGSYNTAVGSLSLENNINGNWNTAIGYYNLKSNINGSCNTSIGSQAMRMNESGRYNIALGDHCLFLNKEGNNNVAIGTRALYSNKGKYNTAIGDKALYTAKYNNCTGIGHHSRVYGDNQVQLGDNETTTYCYGSVQNRSDERDKSDIQDTELGLDFVLGLQPVEFRWDYREDYIQGNEKEDGSIELKEISKDGSKKRKRLHQGFIAQDVKKLMDKLGVDFAGYQDGKINGGEDVLTLGYIEFIPPIVKAIHEQQQIIDELKSKIEMLENNNK